MSQRPIRDTSESSGTEGQETGEGTEQRRER